MIRIDPKSADAIRKLRCMLFTLRPEEQAFCWRIVLSGEPVRIDVCGLKIETTVGAALRYLTINGDIP